VSATRLDRGDVVSVSGLSQREFVSARILSSPLRFHSKSAGAYHRRGRDRDVPLL